MREYPGRGIPVLRRVSGAPGLEQAGRLAAQGYRAQDVRRLCSRGNAAYDLADLYAKYLQGRRGSDEQSRKRIRRADRFQIFLALALLALLADAFTRAYPRAVKAPEPEAEPRSNPERPWCQSPSHPTVPTALFLIATLAGTSRADDPAEAVREGLRSYGKGEFDKARDSFAAAREQFDSGDAAKAAIAAFDQAWPRIAKATWRRHENGT